MWHSGEHRMLMARESDRVVTVTGLVKEELDRTGTTREVGGTCDVTA